LNAIFWQTQPNEPFTFKAGVGKVIKGWDEGVIGLHVGDKVELVCPPDYAYGSGGFPAWGILPNSTLIFIIEVVRIN